MLVCVRMKKHCLMKKLNVLISIKVIESNKGWQPDKTMIISDENEHLIRYAIGFEDYTNYLPSYYFCYDINPNEYLVWD